MRPDFPILFFYEGPEILMCMHNLPFLNVGAIIFKRHSGPNKT